MTVRVHRSGTDMLRKETPASDPSSKTAGPVASSQKPDRSGGLRWEHRCVAPISSPDLTSRLTEHPAWRCGGRRRMHPPGTKLAAQPTVSRRPEPSLTRRQLEIAALVADGLSNAAIVQRLTLSERTMENHVSHILHRLGRTSRAVVASWYTGRATDPNG